MQSGNSLRYPKSRPAKPALEQSRGKGRSRSQRMPDKSLRKEELSRRKSWGAELEQLKER